MNKDELTKITQTRLRSILDCGDDTITNYGTVWSAIAKDIAQETGSHIAIVYLTAEQKILEGVGRSGEQLGQVDPANIPFYSLAWDIVPGYEYLYDGFTSWLALHLRCGSCDYRTMDKALEGTPPYLHGHPSWKGQWDPIVWQGKASGGLDCILASTICVDGQSGSRLYGLIKIERKVEATPVPRPYLASDVETLRFFAAELESYFKGLASNRVDEAKFWRLHAEATSAQKAAQLTSILNRGRSLDYNLTEALGFILETFRILLGAPWAIHVFEPPFGSTRKPYLMPYWRPAWRPAEWLNEDWNVFRKKKLELGQSEAPWRSTQPVPSFLCRLPSINDTRGCLTHLPVDVGADTLIAALQRARGSLRADVGKHKLGINIKLPDSIKPVFEPSPFVSVIPMSAEGAQGPLSIGDAYFVRLAAGTRDFGTVVIPVPENEPLQTLPNNNRLAAIASSMARILDSFLRVHHRLPMVRKQAPPSRQIYLPEAWRAGSKHIGIMFADIRNFTRVNQVLRLLNHEGAIELLMDWWSLVAEGVLERWGRRDKFLGDGLMGVFGEDLENGDRDNREKAARTLCCACELVLAFDEVSRCWLSDRLRPGGLPWRYAGKADSFKWEYEKRKFNEDLDLRIGIGVNLGDVYFDYFGGPEAREYTPIGDQVNFVARLQTNASTWDDKCGAHAPPICMGRTMWEYLKDTGILPPGLIPTRRPFKGLAFDYAVFFINPSDVSLPSIKQSLATEYQSFCDPADPEASFQVSSERGLVLKPERARRLGLPINVGGNGA